MRENVPTGGGTAKAGVTDQVSHVGTAGQAGHVNQRSQVSQVSQVGEVGKVGIIGAGQMGAGIAQVCAAAGLQVVLCDVSAAALQRALDTITGSLERAVRGGKASEEDKQALLARLTLGDGMAALADADCVIEAATEDAALKRRILAEVEAVVKSDCIIATNTSSVSVTRLAGALRQPERFIGMHFFNPVPQLPLVEVIRGVHTSGAVFEAVRALAGQLGKTAVAVRNSPGFVVNRLLLPMINEAIFVLQEGVASAEDIDAGMKLGARHPIGPLALADLIGLDTCLAIMDMLCRDFNDPKYRAAPLLREMVDGGLLGRKAGRGFYVY